MLITKELEYQDEEILCRGFLAYEAEGSSAQPAVMIAPDWGGRGKDACDKAIQLAQLGYVGFAIDMYGQGLTAEDKVERRALMTPLRNDRPKLARRIMAAFETLAQLPEVDRNRIAAIGYCFGGLCVLDLARIGAAVKGVVSFHGLLSAPSEQLSSQPIQAKVLILHGYDDPLVPVEQVNEFAQEMTANQVDWQVHMYGLTAHSFTNPLANDDEMGLHYNPIADKRSWQVTQEFLAEIMAL